MRRGSRSRDALIVAGRITLLSLLEDLGQAPVLRLAQRPGLDDADEVADLGGVLLVVSVELARAANDLLVPRVRLEGVDLDHDGLVHGARDDDATALLAPAARMLGLGQTGDRAPFGGAFTLRLRVLVALGAREPLALPLRAGLGRSGLRLRSRRFGRCCRLLRLGGRLRGFRLLGRWR